MRELEKELEEAAVIQNKSRKLRLVSVCLCVIIWIICGCLLSFVYLVQQCEILCILYMLRFVF